MMRYIVFLLFLVIVDCNQKIPEQTPIQSTPKNLSCSDTILPLGLKFGMSYKQIDSMAGVNDLPEQKGNGEAKEYRFSYGGREFVFSFYKDRLIYFVVDYSYIPYLNRAFFVIKDALSISRLPGGYGIKTLMAIGGGNILEKLPNTLPPLPDNSSNDVFFGTECSDMMVIDEEYNDWGRIWYISIPGSNNVFPPKADKMFRRDFAVVDASYRNYIPTGWFVPYVRDY